MAPLAMDSSWHSCVEQRTRSFAVICEGADDDDDDDGEDILARIPAAAMHAAWYLVRASPSGDVNDTNEDERFWTIIESCLSFACCFSSDSTFDE